MESKTLSLFGLSFLALIVLVGFAIAVTSSVFTITDLDAPTSIDNDAGSFTFTFNLTYTGTSEDMDISFTDSTASIGDLSIPTAVEMNGTIDESRIITGTIDNFTGHVGETIDVVINATTGATTDDETTFSVEITSDKPTEVQTCEATGNPANLEVKDIEITNKGFSHNEFGKDDKWFALDEIEVEITIENDGIYDVDDIAVDWGIYDLEKGEWLIDLDEEKEFNLKDGKEETFVVEFKLDDDLDIDLEDFVDDTDNYRIYVIADGTIDDSDYTSDEEDTCVVESESVTIIIENDFVVLDNIRIPEAACGETVEVFVDVWNIGEDDQDEVSVYITNKDLGLIEDIEIGEIDQFEKEEVSFYIDVPNTAEEKTYSLIFEVYDDDEIYENDFDEDKSEYIIPFTVEGKCAAEVAAISATLESVAQAGQPLVVKAIITNNDNDLKTYTINAADFTEFAESVSIDKTILVLDDGESAEVIFTFDTLKKAAGDYTFYIETAADGEVQRQAVSVSLEPRSGFGVTEGASLPWVIGFLNLVLIVIIIIVAVKVAKR